MEDASNQQVHEVQRNGLLEVVASYQMSSKVKLDNLDLLCFN